ncbi:hypothetical protein [Tessaracoccus sp.]
MTHLGQGYVISDSADSWSAEPGAPRGEWPLMAANIGARGYRGSARS